VKIEDHLPAVCERIGILNDPGAMRELGQLLQQVVHDLNGPIATFGMELYTLRCALDELSAESDAVRQKRDGLAAICNNLERARRTAAEILKVVGDAGKRWSQGDPQGDPGELDR